jgi:NAD+ synthetase
VGRGGFEWINMQSLIELTKSLRQFDAEKYLLQKAVLINQFFSRNNLDACVLGISGGIDSAVSLKLLERAMHRKNSPIKKIIALIMPIDCSGTSEQEQATVRALELVKKTDCDYLIQDLTAATAAYIKQLEDNTEFKTNAWAIGQLASIVRTPCLYFHAALLQQQGFRSLVVGTTNRDEGAYLGFFGKASDAMVDLQPIADLHKSEIYQLARILNIPESIIQSTPRGDVWDNKTDEEMIGAPYWFVELYLLMKEFNLLNNFILTNYLHESDYVLFQTYAAAIEKQHQKNTHKYQVGNPAHFIDLMSRKIPGGW